MSGVSDPSDQHAIQWRNLEDAILRSPGALDASIRKALATGSDIPQPLKAYADKVTRSSHRVTDDDVRSLLAAGYSQDQIFEATLSIAFGAAQTRLQAGLTALRSAQLRRAAPDVDGRAMEDVEE
jgi:hypothetical protein